MVYLRRAEKNDMDLVYRWANDQTVRNNSFQSGAIAFEDHIKWFNSVLASDRTELFILMDDKTPVGQVRVDIAGDEAEISYSIAKNARGKGYGRQSIQLICDEVRESHPEISRLKAKVKKENLISQHVFEGEDFAVKYVCYERFLARGGVIRLNYPDTQYRVTAA